MISINEQDQSWQPCSDKLNSILLRW